MSEQRRTIGRIVHYNDILWVTSVSVGEGARHFAWPARS